MALRCRVREGGGEGEIGEGEGGNGDRRGGRRGGRRGVREGIEEGERGEGEVREEEEVVANKPACNYQNRTCIFFC